MQLQDKVGIVTGAASGIGEAIAFAWAKEGAKVVVSDIDPRGAETAARIVHAGGNAIFVLADVGTAADVRDLVDKTLAHFGRLDIACNNAGIAGPLAPVSEYRLNDWDDVIRVNLTGVFHGLKYQIPAMLKNGGGSIVNIASILGAVGFPGACAYVASKHGIVGLTQAAALDYGAKGIRVNSVGPAFIHTPMISQFESDPKANAALVEAHPLGRVGRAEEVADLVTWLCSDRTSFVTGSYYPIDGGYLAR